MTHSILILILCMAWCLATANVTTTGLSQEPLVTTNSSIVPTTTTTTTTEKIITYSSPGYRFLMVETKCSVKHGTINCDSLGFEEMPQATTFPEEVEFADFRNNHLTSLCAGIFYGGDSLKALYFANNQIFHLESNTFYNLSSISHLDLSHNYLVHIPVEAFNGMDQLNTIDLGYNKIMYLSRDVFLQTRGPFFLKELRLNHNELHELDHDLFHHLFHMDALDLEDNVLEDLPDTIFARNSRLRDLKLSMNHFTHVPTNALSSAKVLDILDLSSNHFKEIGYEDFARLITLTRLRISRVLSLERIKEHSFQDLVNLRQLTIEYNRKLRDISDKAFINNVTGDHLAELTEVSFKGNALSSLSPDTLVWNMIQELDFSDNPWRCDCHLKWIVNLTVNERTEENYVCKQPYKHFNQRIRDMTEEDFSCSFFENDVFIVGGCLLIILTMTGLTSIGFLVAKLKIIPKIFSLFTTRPKHRSRTSHNLAGDTAHQYCRVDPSSLETVSVSAECHRSSSGLRCKLQRHTSRETQDASPCDTSSCPPSRSSRSSSSTSQHNPMLRSSDSSAPHKKSSSNGVACTKV